MKHHIIPDDMEWCYQHGEDPLDDYSDNEDLDDDDDDGDDEDYADTTAGNLGSFENGKQEKEMSHTDLLQSCASSNLNNTFLSGKSRKVTVVDAEESDNDVNSDSDDDHHDGVDHFDSIKFQNAIYSLGKCTEASRLQLLESTEYTIHKNFKRSLKPVRNITFRSGQHVLFKNPEVKQGGIHTFSFLKRNLVGVIKEACEGENYVIEVNDGTSIYLKSIYKGEIVPLNDADIGDGDDIGGCLSEQPRTFSGALLLLSDVASGVREAIYDNKVSFRCKRSVDMVQLMATYFNALDKAFYSKVCSHNPELSQQLKEESDLMLLQLKEGSFGYFMYGAVAWENSRRELMPSSMLKFLKDNIAGFMESHDCIDCFKSESDCRHMCCLNAAKDFAIRVGLKVEERKCQKTRGFEKDALKQKSGKEKPAKIHSKCIQF